MNSGAYYLQFFDPRTSRFVESNSYFTFSRFFNPSGTLAPISYIQVAMTGITGLGVGQTPFTGITGFYTAIDANPLPTTPSNYNHKTSSLSGIRFHCPVSFSQIEMEQINIGDSNIIVGYATGINIGSRNSILSQKGTGLFILTELTGITGLGVGQTPFTGVTGTIFTSIGFDLVDRNFNLGFQNTINTTEEGYNFGGNNIIQSGKNIMQVGLNLESSDVENSTIIGRLNYLLTGNKVILVGNNNDVISAVDLGVIGNNNEVQFYNGNILGHGNSLNLGNSSNANLFGNTNTIKSSSNLNIFGQLNYASGLDSSFVIGSNNFINSTGNIINSNLLILGDSNTTLNSNDQILIGTSHNVQNSSQNILVGKNISSFSSNNLSFGKDNILNGQDGSVYGKLNIIDNSSQNDFIVGINNSLSGTNSNIIIGSSNASNRELLEAIYLQELTGITGLGIGQTPFTGITGSKIDKRYSGIEPIGGNSNFFIGDSNQGTLNYYSYIFGRQNQLLDNTNVNIVGNSNYLEGSLNSYVFGENNTISGSKNYVIGNDNFVRSGDYNNIVIGIGYQFINQNKNTSINLGVIDSEIRITPQDIKLASPDRLKFNDENVLVTSDLNTYLNKENGLNNSGAILNFKQNGNTYIFQDQNYDSLPSKIELSSFGYSGVAREKRYSAQFSGGNSLDKNAYKFNGFFREKPASTYDGSWPILGDYYYRSNNNTFDLVFTKLLDIYGFNIPAEQATGSWVLGISTGYLAALFYNPSTNTGVLPTSNWESLTGQLIGEAEGFSGYNPAPTFTYLGNLHEFSGIFEEEIIPYTPSPNLNNFINLGDKAYKSSQGISVIYGLHTSTGANTVNDPRWLIVDNNSSGIYYKNELYGSDILPQSGWAMTGFMGYTGISSEYTKKVLQGSTGINIVIGGTGFISSYDSTYGKIYIPFYY